MKNLRYSAFTIVVGLIGIFGDRSAQGEELVIRDDKALQTALASLKNGTTLTIASGDYRGGYSIRGVDQLTVEALDPQHPPHFKGGSSAWHFSRCNELTLRHLKVSGQRNNGINLDDGGDPEHPVKGITVEHIEISDIGP